MVEDGKDGEFFDQAHSDDDPEGPSYFRTTNRVAEIVQNADPLKGYSKDDLVYAEEVDL